VFRGCLLPVVAHTFGNAVSIMTTAVLFAAFHSPNDVAHWAWFTTTGIAYGWVRLASKTTTASAFMYATYNQQPVAKVRPSAPVWLAHTLDRCTS
jgi:membrane protease YdiL (CAAX protease family)